MEKPVFSNDILSFCKEMGVESPELLIGKRIYFKYFFQYEGDKEEETIEHIVIAKISEITFGYYAITKDLEEPKNSKVAIISTSAPADGNLVVAYYLDEKRAEIIECDSILDLYFCYASIEELYIYPE